MYKLSLITVSFNSAATIKDTIESVNKQTYPNIEHIIIDGASSDDTVRIVKDYGKRIVEIKSERDNGIYDAYNKGLKLAKGEVIGFLNSDDIYADENVLQKVMEEFNKSINSNLDAVYGNLMYVDKENTKKNIRYWKSKKYQENDFIRGFVPAHPTLFFKSSIYESIGNFDISFRYSGDFDFMLRAFHQTNIKSVFIDEILVLMRDGGQTGGNLKSICKQNNEIFRSFQSNNIKINKLTYILKKIKTRLIERLNA